MNSKKTIKLFQRLDNNEIIFVVSDLLDLELINAHKKLENTYLDTRQINFKELNLPKKLSNLPTHTSPKKW